MIESMQQLVWTMHLDGRPTCVNQFWLDYFGRSFQDSLRNGWMDLVHLDDFHQVKTLWNQACLQGVMFEIKCRMRRHDGVYRWMQGHAVAQVGTVGVQTSWMVSLLDIDDMRQANELVEKTLLMNRIASKVAMLGGWTIDLADLTLTWSDENCLIHDVEPGYKPTLDEGIGYFFPEHRPIVTQYVKNCAKYGTSYEFVLPKLTAKGRTIWVRSIGEAVRDKSGKIIRIQGAFQDITEQKNTEERMQAMEVQIVDTLKSITDGFCMLDKDWKFTFLNAPAERMLNRSPQYLLGKKLWDEFSQEIGAKLTEDLTASIEARRTTRFELYAEQLNAWFHFDVYPTKTGMAAYFKDITERKQQQDEILRLNSELEARVLIRTAELEKANKEMTSFAYSVSHDLRSPLNTVHGFSQLLLKGERESLSDKGKHFLDRISSGVKQMSDLIDGLLMLTRLSMEEMKIKSVDMSAITHQIAKQMCEQNPERQSSWIIQDGLTAQGDARLLLGALQNLICNAWKFTSKQPHAIIEFGAKTSHGETVFFIKDNGVGFDMAFAPKLFGTFERLHSPGDFSGTGIGLATVKRIIERHGGRVWAQSKVSKGATFFFTIGEPVNHGES